jgi:hypothetical protein
VETSNQITRSNREFDKVKVDEKENENKDGKLNIEVRKI